MIGDRGQNNLKILGVSLLLLIVAGVGIGGAVLGPGFGEATEEPKTTTDGEIALSATGTVATISTTTATPRPTPMLTTTSKPTQTPSATATLTPTSTNVDLYRNFLVEMDAGLNQSARTPLRIRGATIEEDVLYIAHNATSADENASRKYVEWGDIAIAYAGAVRDTKDFYNNSEVPSRMVVFETNSSNLVAEPGRFVVTTEDSDTWNNGEISAREFTKRWQDSLERQEQRDEKFASAIDRIEKNVTYYPSKPLEKEDE